MMRMIQIWRRLRCLLFGHAYLLRIDQHRLSVKCAECGDESTGWWPR